MNSILSYNNVFPLIPFKNKNNSILENNYHIENIPIIIPNYNKYKINNSTRHLNYSEHKTFDNNSINKINKRYYIEQDNKYLVENRLYKDNSLNVILKKIYKEKNESEICKNLETDLHAMNENKNKIIFSIYNKANYPKNNYNYEIFDFKTDQKNKQKDINYLMKILNNNKENNKDMNLEINKNNKKNIKKKSKKKKVKPLGLYHRLAGGYQAQNFNVNSNMIIKNKDE